MTNNLSAAKEKSRIDVLFETPNPSILAAAASYYISFFPLIFCPKKRHLSNCQMEEDWLSHGILLLRGCPIKSFCKHGTSRTHLLEYNASLMSQKGRSISLFLAQFHYNGRKSCWSWMDDGWSGHPTRRTTRLHKRKEKGPPFRYFFKNVLNTKKEFIDHRFTEKEMR